MNRPAIIALILLIPGLSALSGLAGSPAPDGGPRGVLPASADPCDSVSANPSAESIFLYNVSIDGGGNTGTVQANDSFTVAFDYYIQVCDSPITATYCQVVVGYATSPQPLFCVFRDRVGCEGLSGSLSFKMKAPAYQTQYLVAFDLRRTITEPPCPTDWPQGPPAPGQYLACITVVSPDIPVPVTGGVDNVTTSSATLHGTVDPVGTTTTARFLIGSAPGVYPDSVTAVESPVSGSGALAVSAPVTGLSGNTRYYYRAVAESENGYNLGAEESFFTGAIFSTDEALHDFGFVEKDGMKTDSVVIRNIGNLPLQVTNAVPLSGQFSVSPTSGVIGPAGTKKFAVTFAPPGYGHYSSGIVFLHAGTTTPDTQAVAGHVPAGSAIAGWNIVSLPLSVADPSKTVIFPGSISDAFEFSNGYYPSDTVEHGRGYWIKYPAAESLVIAGDPRESETVVVAPGWNMVGGPSLPVPRDSISSSPPGILTGTIYGYGAGYVAASELHPANGYWLKTTQAGTLTLKGASALAHPPATLRSAPAPAGTEILVSDADSRVIALRILGPDAGPGGATGAELPPPPPAGAFDVRFAGDRSALGAPAVRIEPVSILISGAVYPVRISWAAAAPAGLELRVDGTVHRLDLPGSAVLGAEGRVSVGAAPAEAGAVLPRGFGIAGNYPNPFNPSTSVRYDLASSGPARVVVYNPLGEEVAVLAEGSQEAGTHTASFDASGLPGGVYFCRLTAGQGTSTIRMLLVK